MIISAKKNAPIATRAAIPIEVVTSVIDRRTMASTIVPIIPARNMAPTQRRHRASNVRGNSDAVNSPTTRNMRFRTARPNEIQIAVVIAGINANAKSTPTTAPTTTLIITAMQMLLLQFSPQFNEYPPSVVSTLSHPLYTERVHSPTHSIICNARL
jgi:hypothetical protein